MNGTLQSILKGHMDTINACCFNEASRELYTGSNDCQIITWQTSLGQSATVQDEDCWSS